MFDTTKRIIYITKDKIVVAEVLDPATKKFGKSFEFGWENTTLDLTFAEIIKKLNSRKFRILEIGRASCRERV